MDSIDQGIPKKSTFDFCVAYMRMPYRPSLRAGAGMGSLRAGADMGSLRAGARMSSLRASADMRHELTVRRCWPELTARKYWQHTAPQYLATIGV